MTEQNHQHFQSLYNRINSWSLDPKRPLTLYGISSDQFSYILYHGLAGQQAYFFKDHIVVCKDQSTLDRIYETIKGWHLSHINVSYFPSFEHGPYSGYIPAESILYERFYALQSLLQRSENKVHLVLTTPDALFSKLPARTFFNEQTLTLRVSDIIAPLDLASSLVALGHQSSITVEGPGQFSRKGEIFDIFPTFGPPFRIQYFDDMIESIHVIDPSLQRTLRDRPLDIVKIGPSPQIVANSSFHLNFREMIPVPQTQFKMKYEKRKHILDHLLQNTLFEDYANFFPLFFNKHEYLFNYLDSNFSMTLIDAQDCEESWLRFKEQVREEFEAHATNVESDNILPGPRSLYQLDDLNIFFKTLHVNEINIHSELNQNTKDHLEIKLEPTKVYLRNHIGTHQNKFDFISKSLDFIVSEFSHSGEVHILSRNENARKEMEFLIENHHFPTSLRSRIHFYNITINEGFYHSGERLLILTDGDLFNAKRKVHKNIGPMKMDLFAEQLATLKVNDFVIHSDHGLGQYMGLESMNIGGMTTDYLVIQYTENDKIYVPVYKMNKIQKQADSTAELKIASLRNNKFQQLKIKAKNSAKKLAFDLLKLQAEREVSESFAFSPPDHEYNEFCLAFPFTETPDQSKAIEDVINEMTRPRPMDFLVCGDVGFGKTEVAMRAAYKAVLDGKQVAVLVPTTVLALQHFNSFKKRFKDFPVEVEFLSRFKSAAESKQIVEKLRMGLIDIIIGTHKILSDNIKFKDLGLVVVDEEQRFGVGHKEKLKIFKSSVDFLTLTATPIPRTLQLSFLGLRDISLIQTPPPRRQSIKSYVIKEDDHTIQNAIVNELKRGGQVFIVHNKVHDIEEYAGYIRELVPTAKIVNAHGQLPEKELEKRMNDFYSGKYQVLISTTIIESGIDIPNANTMIIDRADTYGLSQLHQLRGRIGRSDRKAYAYFVVPKFRSLTPVAEKRLKALQLYADIGSGFNIASIDLEIRGAGDILGAEQSGHLEEVGLEVYMELLQDAIAELKGQPLARRSDVEIQTPFSSFIPKSYIEDSSTRLKYYKKLANAQSEVELSNIQDDINDIFGPFPEEIKNLFVTLLCRIILKNTGLKKLIVAGKIISLEFDKFILESDEILRNRVVDFFIQRPKVYQFSPNYKVTCSYKELVTHEQLKEFSTTIARQIISS